MERGTAGSSNPPPLSTADGKPDDPPLPSKTAPPSYLRRTFYDAVVPELPKVTHPLEYARIAYKVLYRE
ncbi:uncharacterized protein LACBIDRAFT_316705 [Laccaria bicolor S238N-H82]|uniref:Predicted protein n=1 Tax=Laccaria bicolor (strain S238N-H82 / ATCC MYA-4686) TaxID=486041 RepID=B0E1G7_LACBS|nr:uncharacterized protein LACBIDRAFT_316705 [Laccaria bicolor S238N-H82]EDQ99326.1 predicted protein [Laccaria bicolor S238N-H82]|eukprot:XP_001890046.1 predicted protein [Laccaria bicolor S238N-H82]